MWFQSVTRTILFNRSLVSSSYCIQKNSLSLFKTQFIKSLTLLSQTKLKNPILTTKRNKTDAKFITVNFVDRDGEKIAVKAKVGTSLLDVAIDNHIDLEGFGACEGTLSCSTCHLILEKSHYDQLKPPSDEENDMLDLAYGLTDTSRLGCQIVVEEKMNDWTFVVPKEVKDARD